MLLKQCINLLFDSLVMTQSTDDYIKQYVILLNIYIKEGLANTDELKASEYEKMIVLINYVLEKYTWDESEA